MHSRPGTALSQLQSGPPLHFGGETLIFGKFWQVLLFDAL